MKSTLLLQYSSISQWALFIGIALTLFGWFEKKNKILLAGQFLFLLLGLFAIWVLLSGQVNIGQTETKNITKEMKVLSFYRGVLILNGINLISLFLKLFKLRFQKASLAVVILIALMLFFMIFNILQMPA